MTTLRARAAIVAGALVALLSLVTPATAIIGGEEAAEGEWEFTAAIEYRGRQGCGAALVSREWALTAAHCVAGQTQANMTVVVGRSDLESKAGAVLKIASIVTHPGYAGGDGSDIAAIRLASPVPVGVATIAVTSEEDNRFERPGTPVRVTGWGDTTPTMGLNSSSRMREVELAVTDDGRCGTRNPGFRAATGVCAEALLKDSCNGDSGGPLFAVDGGRPVLVGLVSSGIGCATPEFPGVYTEVNAPGIRSWIRTNTGV